MNIDPNQPASSIAGAPRAASRGDGGASNSNSVRQSRDAIQLQELSQTQSISESGHADQRDGDGRQLSRDHASARPAGDELDLSSQQPTVDANPRGGSSPSRLDYQA